MNDVIWRIYKSYKPNMEVQQQHHCQVKRGRAALAKLSIGEQKAESGEAAANGAPGGVAVGVVEVLDDADHFVDDAEDVDEIEH